MLKLQGIAVGETPIFASVLAEKAGAHHVLFEEWTPTNTNNFVREFFTPFIPDEIESALDEPAPEASDDEVVEVPVHEVHTLQDKQDQTA
jgi:hypothetical protein